MNIKHQNTYLAGGNKRWALFIDVLSFPYFFGKSVIAYSLIKKFVSTERLVKEVVIDSADVIISTEVTIDSVPKYKKLLAMNGYEHAVNGHSNFFGRDSKVGMNLAVLIHARVPIEAVDLPEELTRSCWGSTAAIISDESIFIIGVHLSGGFAERNRELETLVKYLQREVLGKYKKVIVSGDFNTPTHKVSSLFKSYGFSFDVKEHDTYRLFDLFGIGIGFNRQIDATFIFGGKIQNSKTVTGTSDHRGILSKISWGEQANTQ